MEKSVSNHRVSVGRKDGRRSLDSETARARVRVRMAKRAYREFYALCFWSCDPELKIKIQDVSWVAEQLMKNGGREAWDVGALLTAGTAKKEKVGIEDLVAAMSKNYRPEEVGFGPSQGKEAW